MAGQPPRRDELLAAWRFAALVDGWLDQQPPGEGKPDWLVLVGPRRLALEVTMLMDEQYRAAEAQRSATSRWFMEDDVDPVRLVAEVQRRCEQKADQLGRAEADERHLWIWVDVNQPALWTTATNLVTAQAQTDPLPALELSPTIDFVWVAPHPLFPDISPRADGWDKVTTRPTDSVLRWQRQARS